MMILETRSNEWHSDSQQARRYGYQELASELAGPSMARSQPDARDWRA
jgi:hypothetical protein